MTDARSPVAEGPATEEKRAETAAAPSETRNESLTAATTRGVETAARNSRGVPRSVVARSAASGARTTSERKRRVTPSAGPKPGRNVAVRP